MIDFTESILRSFESGKITRREAARRLAAMALSAVGMTKGSEARSQAATFQSTGLNHLGLRVSDVAQSRDFYQKQLGLSILRDSTPYNCFMACGENYIGLFRSNRPGMDHYCYTVEGYEPNQVEAKLKKAGIDSRREANRVYFSDPDGLTVQVDGKWDSWPGPLPPR
ncbi:VOC family protein [bacterium]|nr:VOC family protein [bacterium]